METEDTTVGALRGAAERFAGARDTVDEVVASATFLRFDAGSVVSTERHEKEGKKIDGGTHWMTCVQSTSAASQIVRQSFPPSMRWMTSFRHGLAFWCPGERGGVEGTGLAV